MVLGAGWAIMWPLGPGSMVPLEWTEPPVTVTSPLPRSLTPGPMRHRPQERADPGVSAARAALVIGMLETPVRAPMVVGTSRVGITTLSLVGVDGFEVPRASSLNEMHGLSLGTT